MAPARVLKKSIVADTLWVVIAGLGTGCLVSALLILAGLVFATGAT